MPLVRKPQQPVPVATPEAAEVLTRLGSQNSDERWAAARAAADIPNAQTQLASALLVETDARVREAMFTSLGRIGTVESLGKIVPLLRSDDAALRTGALDTLCASASVTPQLLAELLRDADVDVRILSCELARTLASEEATQSLCGLLSVETDINVCGAAVEVLAEVGSAAALPALRQAEQRFARNSFLAFAIKSAIERINAQTPLNRG
jgi:HEAT repeat protein